MKSFCAFASLASLVLAISVFAQEPGPADVGIKARHAHPEGPVVKQIHEEKLPELHPNQVTPEFYLYMQEIRRHDDPKQAIRRKAEAKTAARDARIAAMKWYGMSNARPQANPVPFMSTYSPTWIGNGYDRYDWYGIYRPSVTLRVDQDYELRR